MNCLFCTIVAGASPAEVVFDSPDVFAFLDIRPVFKGHTLVVPKQHVVTLPDLPVSCYGPLFGAVSRLAQAMLDALGADGSFVAMNNTVSQAVPHLHVHVVPRRRKDGLRGFFWPRVKYDDDAEMADYGARLRQALTSPE